MAGHDDKEAPHYAPTEPGEGVILHSPSEGAYERLGDIFLELKGAPPNIQIFVRLKLPASTIGANAVVLDADRAGLTGGPDAEHQRWGLELTKEDAEPSWAWPSFTPDRYNEIVKHRPSAAKARTAARGKGRRSRAFPFGGGLEKKFSLFCPNLLF